MFSFLYLYFTLSVMLLFCLKQWFVYFFNSFYYPLDVNILFPYSLFFLPIIFWFKRGREKLVLPEVKMWDKQRMFYRSKDDRRIPKIRIFRETNEWTETRRWLLFQHELCHTLLVPDNEYDMLPFIKDCLSILWGERGVVWHLWQQ
jgi:hypothetical protein